MKTHFISFLLFCCVQFTAAQELALIPYPNQVNVETGELTYKKVIPFSLPSHLKLEPATIISQAKGYDIKFIVHKKGGAIKFKKMKNLADEAYQLTINKKGIIIGYGNKSGAFYALQTLNQLIRKNGADYTIPYVSISDQPAFHWRAYMLDESRHFQGMKTVKTLLDEMARLKMNIFHWHLVDDPGWRIEIDKYPRLTSIGSKRDFSNREMSTDEWTKRFSGR